MSTDGIVSDDLNDIELSDQEIADLIRKAKIAKRAKLHELAYAEQLRKAAIPPVFDAKQLKAFVFKRYPKIKLDQHNENIFKTLCLYFSNDPAFETIGEGFSLEKGILLFGPVGCGKTHLMDVFSINTRMPYVVVECMGVASDYEVNGEAYLNRYINPKPAYAHQNLGHDKLGWCFDDLGFEDRKKRFGNDMNTMEWVLSRAYRNGMKGKVHITTNLNRKMIEETYGPRLASRMHEMFNFIVFDINSPDRRKQA